MSESLVSLLCGGRRAEMQAFPAELSGRYQFRELIGHGGQAKVAKYWDQEGARFVAVKEYVRFDESDANAKEFEILTTVSHPNIVKCFATIEREHATYLVQEFLSGYTLDKVFDWQQKVDESLTFVHGGMRFLKPEVQELVMSQLFMTLHFLHSNGILHRDVKPENIIFDEKSKSITLIDFGSAREASLNPASTFCGTLIQMSPEQLNGGSYDSKIDIWAAGITLYRMACGYPPFDGKGMIERILKADFSFPEFVGDRFRRIISACLVVDRDQRYAADQILLHFFPLARQTLVMSLHEMLERSSNYKIACFNGRGRLQSYTTTKNNISSYIVVTHHELSIEKTLPTPSFFRALSACVFFVFSEDDRETANQLLKTLLKPVEIVFSWYREPAPRLSMAAGQTEILLFDGNIELQILIYLNQRFPGFTFLSGQELDLDKAPAARHAGCC